MKLFIALFWKLQSCLFSTGSSAGAGSGEFHVYRHLRRKEYTRQKMIDEKAEVVSYIFYLFPFACNNKNTILFLLSNIKLK